MRHLIFVFGTLSSIIQHSTGCNPITTRRFCEKLGGGDAKFRDPKSIACCEGQCFCESPKTHPNLATNWKADILIFVFVHCNVDYTWWFGSPSEKIGSQNRNLPENGVAKL